MLGEIIKKEILDTITSPKFFVTFILCFILILLSFYTGINNYLNGVKEYRTAQELDKKNLESQSNYQVLAGLGTKINKPPIPLSTLANGLEGDLGRVATVNIAFDPKPVDSKFNSNPIFAIFGILDISFVIKIVLSLFAILFTYDAIVGEKEKGTLKLTLANPVPRDKLILGKAIGGFISLMVPFIIPLLIGLLVLSLYPSIDIKGEDWIRIMLICAVFIIYLSVFFTLGLFISSRTSRSSTSFLILLFVWVLFVTIIPKASVMTAGQVYKIPSIHEVSAQKDANLQQIQRESQQEVLKFFNDNPNDGTPEWQEKFRNGLGEIQNDATERIDTENAKIEENFRGKQTKLRQLAMNIARISPTSSMSFAVMDLARSGINRHEDFFNAVKAHKPVWTKWANEKIISSIDFQQPQPGETPKLDLSDMPQFVFNEENIGVTVKRIIPDIAIMLIFLILFFALAYFSFLKYDVR